MNAPHAKQPILPPLDNPPELPPSPPPPSSSLLLPLLAFFFFVVSSALHRQSRAHTYIILLHCPRHDVQHTRKIPYGVMMCFKCTARVHGHCSTKGRLLLLSSVLPVIRPTGPAGNNQRGLISALVIRLFVYFIKIYTTQNTYVNLLLMTCFIVLT